jgi:hypothetical protein
LQNETLNIKNSVSEWDKKQKRAFHNITTGLKVADKQNVKIRFLTLTTSDIQKENIEYDDNKMNDSIRKFKQRAMRITVLQLIKDGYIKNGDIRRYYSHMRLNQRFPYDYFRIRTNEGNGVAHILYKGEYLPYGWIVDNWMDIHNSWNVDIRLIKRNKQKTISRYIVSQYLSNQDTSFVRSSQSWGWITRGFRNKWFEFLDIMNSKYFYNPLKRRYYKRNRLFNENQKSIDFSPTTRGNEVNIFDEWYKFIYCQIKIKNGYNAKLCV